MPLVNEDIPAEILESIDSGLRNLVQDGSYAVKTLRDLDPSSLKIIHGYPVCSLSASDLLRPEIPLAFPLVAWEFILAEGEEAKALAQANRRPDDHAWILGSINRGPFVRSTSAALTEHNVRLTEVQEEWAFRVLSAPATYLRASWLIGQEDREEFGVLDPAPDYLTSARPYTRSELREALRVPVERKLRSYRRPD